MIWIIGYFVIGLASVYIVPRLTGGDFMSSVMLFFLWPLGLLVMALMVLGDLGRNHHRRS